MHYFILKNSYPQAVDTRYTPWSIKMCHFCFLNSFVKHWPILIFGLRHHERTWCKWL